MCVRPPVQPTYFTLFVDEQRFLIAAASAQPSSK